MRSEHKEVIIHFLRRPLMYVYRLDKEQIVAFIRGFEIGSEGNVNLSEQVSTWLKNRHQITKSNPGWPGQIQVYADRKSISWFDAFSEVVSAILDCKVP